MIIREEKPEDFSAIHALVETAFKTAKVSDGDEHEFVCTLRERGGYIPHLALVAEDDGTLVGHIMITKTRLIDGAGNEVPALLLAPVSVVEERRDQGIGSALIREALARAGRLHFAGVFLAGDPAYYARFGFVRTTDLGIVPEGDIPPQFVLGLELRPGALPKIGEVAVC